MQIDELLRKADTYFAGRIDAEEWRNQPPPIRVIALRTAASDIAVELGLPEIDGHDKLQFEAVCEQAIHLTRRRPRPRRMLVSEEISGLGRRTWENLPPEELPEFSRRARRLLEAVLSARTGRIGRG